MEAIILAGGLGTRLRSKVKHIPKSLAPIQSRPFLEYLLDHLIAYGINRIVFSVGYKADHISDYFKHSYKGCEIVYATEEKPLGTGGAIKNAMKLVTNDEVLVANGDSLFLTDLTKLFNTHRAANADVTFALKLMKNIKRYGTLKMNEDNRITHFYEKKPTKEGLINTGTYIFNTTAFLKQNLPEVFSIEKDFFEQKLEKLTFIGHPSSGYFLDIGIPVDFKKAQHEIGLFTKIDHSWTLFLDRDGVINRKICNNYVKNIDELELLPGAIEAIAACSKIFGRVIIVTNQQGIGKNLMTKKDLMQIHQHIIEQVEKKDGQIDAIYYAPKLASEQSKMRKPKIGMALKAKKDFPNINFSKSILIGDSESDMEFAKRAQMNAVLVSDTNSASSEYCIRSLSDFKNILFSLLNL